VVPDTCRFTVDVRTTDAYSLEETLKIIRENVKCEVTPRSVRLRPSGITNDQPLRKAVEALGIKTYGSPTLSDQALMPFPTVKVGPGDSARSHSADEFVYLSQLENGFKRYIKIIEELKNQLS
jgi:acetylornithine deacetylase